MKKQVLRRIAQQALMNEFGFSPALSAITILEANGEGTYILFHVNDRCYRFESWIMSYDNSFRPVWVGAGTISRCRYGQSQCCEAVVTGTASATTE